MEKKYSRKPCKIPVIKSSQYEAGSAIHHNRKYWHKVFQEMDTSTTSDYEKSRHLSQVLPDNLYEKVCEVLELPRVEPQTDTPKQRPEKIVRRLKKQPLLSYRKTLYIDREMDSDTDVEVSPRDDVEEELNVHRELLRKPVREQITWATHYLQPEREDEKSLVTKADDVTNRIATDFAQYMTELGGNQQSQLFTPKAIKELFQVEFDTHVARGLQVVPKELPTVLDRIATVSGNPERSQLAMLEREVSKDIAAERRPELKMAFNYSIPPKEQWHAPKNNTKTMWRSARHVPKDLVSLKTVWEGITNLRSVREYCRWMIEHPEYRRAPYLLSLGMFDPAVLEARMTLELNNMVAPPSPDHSPSPIDHIRRRLSQLADTDHD
ncbi:uncharacterized protein LOC126366121 [Pectinophora gossypiella]|uniref:uncharacterized protein LOC126366121 n=1 Tax=Pectinophora gossypiella TaxID=13191 RepID=UPI00214EAE9B|nr:uncharacterized protein LOC126366121 [Pectinophora gossypiella]